MDESFLATLNSKLSLIDDLGERLVHVKWSRETFTLLSQTAQETMRLVQQQYGYEPIAELIARLGRQVDDSIRTGQFPQGAERERLFSVLKALRQHIPPAALETATGLTRPTTRPPNPIEIWLLAESDDQQIAPSLEAVGFQMRLLRNLAEVRNLLVQQQPAALIVDLDASEGSLFAAINMVAEGKDRSLKAPCFFISERSDLAARLEAISAGGVGYFTKPLNKSALLESLNDWLLHKSARGYRVLIVEDKVAEAQRISNILEERRIVTHIVHQPLHVLQALHRFQPDLLILDLELGGASGVDIAKAIRQHEAFENLPMILLAAPTDLKRHLSALGAGGDDLLSKPIAAEGLLAAVTYRLRRAQALYHKLARLGQRDSVSGLYNRRYFLDQLHQVLQQQALLTPAAGANHRPYPAVILISLDNLRSAETNDIAISDLVVEQAARRLQKALGFEHPAARFGDATFAVLTRQLAQEAVIELSRKSYLAVEREAYTVGNTALRLRVSVGISIGEPGIGSTQLIQQADLACSMARKSQTERIHIYHPQADQAADESRQQTLLNEIRDAARQERMSLVFQPIASLRGDATARYEVLLRMYDREGHEILPETVFGIAQRYRLGVMLERWVIAKVIQLLQERLQQGVRTIFFVNLSPAIIHDEEFADWLKGQLHTVAIHPEDLVLEMAEITAEHYIQKLQSFLKETKALGCSFSLDNFGARSTSQQLLRELPVDYVKLDAQFVQNLADDKDKQKRLQTMITELTKANVTTVVGSIEDLPTLYALWSCGVNYVQGYYLQRPDKKMEYDFSGSAL